MEHGRVAPGTAAGAPGRRPASARSRARARSRRARHRARPGSRADRPPSFRCPSRPGAAPGSSGARGSPRRSRRSRPPAPSVGATSGGRARGRPAPAVAAFLLEGPQEALRGEAAQDRGPGAGRRCGSRRPSPGGRAPRVARATSRPLRLRPSARPRRSAGQRAAGRRRSRRAARRGGAAETGPDEAAAPRGRASPRAAARPSPGSSDDAHRLARGEPLEDGALRGAVRRASPRAPCSVMRYRTAPGRGKPRRKRALQDLARRGEEPLAPRARPSRAAPGGQTGSSSSTSRDRASAPGAAPARRVDDDAGQDALGERDPHARARGRHRAALGHRVREAASQRQRQGDRDRARTVALKSAPAAAMSGSSGRRRGRRRGAAGPGPTGSGAWRRRRRPA